MTDIFVRHKEIKISCKILFAFINSTNEKEIRIGYFAMKRGSILILGPRIR